MYALSMLQVTSALERSIPRASLPTRRSLVTRRSLQCRYQSSATPKSSGAAIQSETTQAAAAAPPPKTKPKRTQAEADAALMAAYREKFGGETTAMFEDGKPSEMGRAVKNNMFRYI